MKRALCLGLATVALAVFCNVDSAQAARRVRQGSVQTGSQGPFQRLMELERRKNERLRQIFFGG